MSFRSTPKSKDSIGWPWPHKPRVLSKFRGISQIWEPTTGDRTKTRTVTDGIVTYFSAMYYCVDIPGAFLRLEASNNGVVWKTSYFRAKCVNILKR